MSANFVLWEADVLGKFNRGFEPEIGLAILALNMDMNSRFFSRGKTEKQRTYHGFPDPGSHSRRPKLSSKPWSVPESPESPPNLPNLVPESRAWFDEGGQAKTCSLLYPNLPRISRISPKFSFAFFLFLFSLSLVPRRPGGLQLLHHCCSQGTPSWSPSIWTFGQLFKKKVASEHEVICEQCARPSH